MAVAVRLFILGLIFIAAGTAANFAHDQGFAIHMTLVAIGAAAAILVEMFHTRPILNFADDPDGYQMNVVRFGVVATAFWAVIGLLVGVVVASQLAWPELNIEPYLNFGRLRPLHTSAVIFAFGGTALLTTSF